MISNLKSKIKYFLQMECKENLDTFMECSDAK